MVNGVHLNLDPYINNTFSPHGEVAKPSVLFSSPLNYIPRIVSRHSMANPYVCPTIQHKVEPGDETGFYHVTFCNVSSGGEHFILSSCLVLPTILFTLFSNMIERYPVAVQSDMARGEGLAFRFLQCRLC